MSIVGISGSPIPGGNTDRLVQSLLEQTGREHQFVNLSTLDFVPCRACAHLCAKSNICSTLRRIRLKASIKLRRRRLKRLCDGIFGNKSRCSFQ